MRIMRRLRWRHVAGLVHLLGMLIGWRLSWRLHWSVIGMGLMGMDGLPARLDWNGLPMLHWRLNPSLGRKGLWPSGLCIIGLRSHRQRRKLRRWGLRRRRGMWR